MAAMKINGVGNNYRTPVISVALSGLRSVVTLLAVPGQSDLALLRPAGRNYLEIRMNKCSKPYNALIPAQPGY
jgi:hypothetical protein